MKRMFYILAIYLSITFSYFAQNDSYYTTINTSSGTFVSDLQTRIRTPYSKISYADFDETNITYFAQRDTTLGRKVVTCVYSGDYYIFPADSFKWGYFSREHTWCHSWMPTYDSESGEEYSDQHHLFPTNQNNANGVRSNHPLGVVVNISSTFGDAKYGKNSLGQNVYEPRASHKGDAARALLYMSVRYNGVNSNNWTFNYLNSTTLPGLTNPEAPQDVDLLIQWHKEDPPDQWEVARNNYIESIQQNRNPFVDHPEYVNYINWGDLTKANPIYATEPANYVTGLGVSNLSNTITISWTDAVEGSQVPQGYFIEAYDKNAYFIPIDGSVYDVDTDLSDGRALVYVNYSDANSYSFPNLVNGTEYYFRVYSFNGNTTATNYKTTGTIPSVSLYLNTGTADEPQYYPTNITTSNITLDGIQLNWVDAVGDPLPSGYLIQVNTSGSFVAPIDGNSYADDTNLSDGSGIKNIEYSGDDFNLFSGLLSNTTYYFRIYSYNGTGSITNYKTDGTVPNISATTLAVQEPENHLTNLSSNNITAVSFNLTWTDAIGSPLPTGYLIDINTDNNFTTPADGTEYSNDTDFSDNKGKVNIVFSESTGEYEVAGLTPSTTYYVKIYSFVGNGSSRNYKTDGSIPTTTVQTVAIQYYNTSLFDDFNRTNTTDLGNSLLGVSWDKTETVSNSSVKIESNRLKLSSAIAGRELAYVDLSQLADYPVQFNTANKIMTWAFNFKQTRPDPSGFDSGNYGMAFVLGSTVASSSTGSGYAVVLGETGSTDEIRLVSFIDGMLTSGKLTNIISGNDYGANYLSVKVTYNPSGNLWSLYCDSDGSSFPQTDPRNTTGLISSANVANSVYTGLNLKYMMAYWNHSITGTENALFDDIYISNPGNVLPVELNSFGAVRENNIIRLNWTTASEINNYGFDIERKIKVGNWQKIGFVEGMGNSNVNNSYTFFDENSTNTECLYRLKQIDLDGGYKYSEIIKVESNVQPTQFVLHQNYPNPFNPSTKIEYYVPEKSRVEISVYDLLGQVLEVLVNEEKNPGHHEVMFNSNNISSGVYYYTLKSSGVIKTNKMTVLK